MSVNRPSPEDEQIKKLRRQVEHSLEQLAALAGSNIPPAEFYPELIQRGVLGIGAFAGAVWIQSQQGLIQPLALENFERLGLDDRPESRQLHNALVAVSMETKKSAVLGPNQAAQGFPNAGNPTPYLLVLTPFYNENNEPCGLIELLHPQNIHPQDLLTYASQLSGWASQYIRNNSAKRLLQEQRLLTEIESFSRKVHSSLNPTQVAYYVANETRRLIKCDRVSVGVRHGRKVTIEAVSGADTVERASSHIIKMRKLFDAVIEWGEKLTFKGKLDPTLPPNVRKALDEYLKEKTPSLLVLLPLRDDREKNKEGEKKPLKPSRSALMMEVFDPQENMDQMEEQLLVLSKHAETALYNAAEMKSVPLKPLWWPLQKVQQGLGGKARFWLFTAVAAFFLLVFALIYFEAPIKVDAKGRLVPLDRHYVYSNVEGQVREIKVFPNQEIPPDAVIAVLYNSEYDRTIRELQSKEKGLDHEIETIKSNLQSRETQQNPQRKAELETQLVSKEAERNQYRAQLDNYAKNLRCDLTRPGYYTVHAPNFLPARAASGSALWRVVTPDFREQLLNKSVKNSDPVVRVGNVNGGWEIELKIPQKHIGRVIRGFKTDDPNEYLEVDVLVSSQPLPGHQGVGRLYRRDISSSAEPNLNDQDENEPVVRALVRINTPDIDPRDHIDEKLLVTDIEVRTKIRCQSHSIGYSYFYGVWEFLYERVIFPYF